MVETLNEYCLLHILEFLSLRDRLNCSLVCKRWHTISQQNWRVSKVVFTFQGFPAPKEVEHLEHDLVREAINLSRYSCRHVTVDCSYSWPVLNTAFAQFDTQNCQTFNLKFGDFFRLMKRASNKVESISLTFPKSLKDFPVKALQKFLDSKPKLKKLKLTSKTDECLDDYIELKNVELENLTLEKIKLRSTRNLCSFLEKATRLRGLELLDCDVAVSNVLQTLTKACARLQVLCLTRSAREQMHVVDMRDILKLENLEKLVIEGYKNSLSGDILVAMSRSFRKIKELGFRGGDEKTDREVNTLITSLPSLEILSLKHVKINKLSLVPSLRVLVLFNCKELSIKSTCEAIQAMTELQELEVYACFQPAQEIISTAISIAVSRNQVILITERINYPYCLTDTTRIAVHKATEYLDFEQFNKKSSFQLHIDYEFNLKWKVQDYVRQRFPTYSVSCYE